jgi:hypothetical protein
MNAFARAALAAVVLGGLLTVTGCVAPEPAPTVTPTVTSPTPTVTPTASPTATPTEEPEPAPAPDPAAYDAGDPGTWAIDYAGIGPFVVGETLGEIEADLPHPPETCRPGVDTYAFGPLGLTAVSGIDESNPDAPVVVVRLLAVEVLDPTAPQPRTSAGIGLGDTVAELQDAHPEVEATQDIKGAPVYQLLADSRVISFQIWEDEIGIISVSENTGPGSEYCGA